MNRARQVVVGLATASVMAHIVISVFDNLPDDTLSFEMRVPLLKKIPHWNFFAPNPGIEDLYVMCRSRTTPATEWTAWANLALEERDATWSAFWNPGSRSTKALFDTAQQIRVLAGHGSTFDWVLGTPGYQILADFVRGRCRLDEVRGQCQFMVVAAVPSEGNEGILPVMVSSELDIDPDSGSYEQLTV